jgi:low affinity Fe/Cu permease
MKNSRGQLFDESFCRCQFDARSSNAASDQRIAIANQTNNRKNGKETDERGFFCRVQDVFRIIAQRTARTLGTAWAFCAAVAVIIIWGVTGPTFHYSDTWQLIINTGTTIVTFLMVFLIQNTQNRDAKAVHLKLDELIRALKGARNNLVDLEGLSDEELKKLQTEFIRIRKKAEQAEKPGKGVSEVQSAQSF